MARDALDSFRLVKSHRERLAARKVVDGALELQQLELAQAHTQQRLEACAASCGALVEEAVLVEAVSQRERNTLKELEQRAMHARHSLEQARQAHHRARQEVKSLERLGDRLVQRNVLAMSGRAVEAAGDVSTLLLDKTGTITFGNRRASDVLPVEGATREELLRAAYLSSLADETPEGRSIVDYALAEGRGRAVHR